MRYLHHIKCLLAFAAAFLFLLSGAANAGEPAKPPVRAITAFVRVDRANMDRDVRDALVVLRQARQELVAQGYEVQTVRIVTQPLAELVGGLPEADALALLKRFDELSQREGFAPNVGPAMSSDADDPRTMRLLAKALTTLPNLQASAIIADDDGIHWKVIGETALLVRYVADHSMFDNGGRTQNLNFAATAMLKPYSPFYPGAYHRGPGKQFSIGLESANVVLEVFSRTRGDFDASVSELTQELAKHAKIAETAGRKVAAATGWAFVGVDPTPAPTPGLDSSIGAAVERYTGAPFGSSGTLTASLAITTAVKAVPVQQAGYSGLMIPVMEDSVIAERWATGAIGMDDLLAYSTVCGTGLDTVPLPGNTSVEQLSRIYGDVAALAWKWKKPLSARLLLFRNLAAGDRTKVVSKTLLNTTIQSLP